MIPLVAMLGTGLDTSRTYLVKSRLQSACDAGALAARKALDGSGTLNTAATDAGNAFFNNNFPVDTYGTSNRSFTMTLDSSHQINGTAKVTVPMTLMAIFNKRSLDVNATCGSRLDIKNADVMFVLDTTGSMAGARIVGLRSAVMDFTATLNEARQGDARIRYGFVPYSNTVNVGNLLRSASNTWVADRWSYRSRTANFNTGVVTAYKNRSNPTSPVVQTVGANDLASCRDWGNDYDSAPVVLSRSGNTAQARSYSNTDADYTASGNPNQAGTCKRRYVDQTYVDPLIRYRFTNWTYGTVPYDATLFKNANVRVAMDDPPATYTLTQPASSLSLTDLPLLPGYLLSGADVQSFQWDGCIEERDTVPNATFYAGSLPPAAYDLNIDMVPMSTQTTWRPTWPQTVWDPTTYGGPLRLWDYRSGGIYACPSPARKLAVMTQSEVQSYVNGLVAIGGTYHDVGMIWGSRLISPTGIFGAENKTAPNKDPISRNVVFMTDGEMKPGVNVVGMYGYETFDKRVTGAGTPTDADLKNRHNSRFVATCQALQSQGVNLYVVAFGDAVTPEEQACANPGKVYFAKDSAELKTKFVEIATKIAQLRLSQ